MCHVSTPMLVSVLCPLSPVALSITLSLHRATTQVTLSICLLSRPFVPLILRNVSHDGDNDDDDYDDDDGDDDDNVMMIIIGEIY